MSEAPKARVVYEDGSFTPLDMHRDASRDRPPGHPDGEVTYWRAVPREPVRPDMTHVIEHTSPPHTGFWVDAPLHFLAGLDDGSHG